MDLEKQKLRIYNLIADGKRALIDTDYDNAIAWLKFAEDRISSLKETVEGVHTEQPSTDYIECGGIKWLNQADTEVFYKWDDADAASLVLPTKEELERFIERTCYSFDKERKVGIFVDRETSVKLELPANGYHDHTDGSLKYAGTRGYYWASTQSSSIDAYYLHFDENGCAIGGCDKQDGHSVRLVRR